MITFLGTMLTGCADQQEIVLSREDLRLADSLFLITRNEWNTRLQDSCNVLREMMLQTWTDSIKDQRLSEINLMLEHYEQNK